MGIKSTWEGFTNYLTSTKEEVVNEWDEFQDEIDETSSYDQSTASDVLQQTSNGLSFVAEAVGSLVNNKSTRELANETLEDIVNSETYQDVTQTISKGVSKINKEVDEYLDTHPETKAKLKAVAQNIDNTIDEGMSQAKTFITQHDEAFRNVGAVGAIVVAAVPLAKGAKALNAVRTVEKVDINVASLKFSEVRHSQDTISFHKKDRKTQEKFTYDDIKESMSKEGWKGEAVDVIKMPDGKLTSIDNSRVSAAKEVGISIKANVRNYDEKLSSEVLDSKRFIKRGTKGETPENPTTWGEAIDNRIANQSAHFRSKEGGQGSHDLPRVTGRPETLENVKIVGKDNNELLNTNEKLLMAIGVSTAITADTLHESVQSSNTLEENTIDLTQYLPQSVQNKNVIDDSTYENTLPPSIDSYLDQFKSENNQTQYNTKEEDYSKEDDLDTYLPQSVQRTDTITPSYHEDTIEETFNDDNTTLEAQRIYNDMAERNGWNNDYGNDYDRGMEID